jgi:hypothetical protein
MARDTNRDIRPKSRQSSGLVCRAVSTTLDVSCIDRASGIGTFRTWVPGPRCPLEGVKRTLGSLRSENEGKLTCSGHAHSRDSSSVSPEVSFRVFKELLLKEKALTIARASVSSQGGTVFGERLDRFPLLNRKRAFVIRHHIGRID